MKSNHIKTIEQVKAELLSKGLSIAKWASKNAVSKHQTYLILQGKRGYKIGESHKIAVLLGIKEGEIVN